MIFTNPWGLLALFSLPAILALHFFRDRRRVIRVGGLHLWDQSRTSLPAGRRFDRLLRSLSLLFQLLAALLLSLLVAGLDIPDSASVRHYTVILDDSVSMAARDARGETSARRAVRALSEWAGARDRYTLIAAGVRPRVLAGPFAKREEMTEALARWSPRSVACDLEAASNLAAKFATGTGRILLVTDSEAPARSHPELFVVHAVGKPAPNIALAAADRVRVGPRKDRVLVTVRSFAAQPEEALLRVHAGEAEVLARRLELKPGEAAPLEFETELVDQTLTLRLGDDALEEDNVARLAPVVTKTVRVLVDDFGSDLRESFEKAIESVPYARVTGDPKAAAMVLTRDPKRYGSPGALRTYVLADPPSSGTLKVAQGRELFCDRASPLTADLPLEGVLWPYMADATTSTLAPPLIAHAGQPLFHLTLERADGARFYALNLVRDKTNLFRQPAWPLLVQALIEECRLAIPGPTRSSFRTGEEVVLNLRPDSAAGERFRLQCDGRTVAEYDELPAVLQDLPPGAYEVVQGENTPLAAFNVNLAAPAESDLSGLASRAADFKALEAEDIARHDRNRLLYYVLLLGAILFGAMSWAFNDSSR